MRIHQKGQGEQQRRSAVVRAKEAPPVSTIKLVSDPLRSGSAPHSRPHSIHSTLWLGYDPSGPCQAVLFRSAAVTTMLDSSNSSSDPWIGVCGRPKYKSTPTTAVVCAAFSSRNAHCPKRRSTLLLSPRAESVALRPYIPTATSLTGFVATFNYLLHLIRRGFGLLGPSTLPAAGPPVLQRSQSLLR